MLLLFLFLNRMLIQEMEVNLLTVELRVQQQTQTSFLDVQMPQTPATHQQPAEPLLVVTVAVLQLEMGPVRESMRTFGESWS